MLVISTLRFACAVIPVAAGPVTTHTHKNIATLCNQPTLEINHIEAFGRRPFEAKIDPVKRVPMRISDSTFIIASLESPNDPDSNAYLTALIHDRNIYMAAAVVNAWNSDNRAPRTSTARK
jgi:hypothetical protein